MTLQAHLSELERKHRALEEEIADLRATEQVDAELEAMKAAMKARGV